MEKFIFKTKEGDIIDTDEIIQSDGAYFITKENLEFYDDDTMWRYFDLIPLNNKKNIVSLNEGRTSLKRVENLETLLNGAKLFIKCESENPEGTFKDREASYVISKAKELGLNKIVFHSTGNTGRAYSLYAKKAGIESYFFLPLSCMDKCDKNMISDINHIIAVDGKFSDVSKIAKEFAKKNNIQALAPLHDKLEGKATLAYEQFEECPEATMFVQTIAGGYGIIGYLMGHERLRLLNISNNYKIPKIVAIQVEDSDTIKKAIINGLENLTEKDLKISEIPFEKTLQSTNPLKTYEQVNECIKNTNGLIESVSVDEVLNIKDIFEKELRTLDIDTNFDNEKSPFISFAGLVKLAHKDLITNKDTLYLVLTGKGKVDQSTVEPDAIVKPTNDGYILTKKNKKLKGIKI